MKNSFVSLGGLSPIQKQGAEVYHELCAIGVDFCMYSRIGAPDILSVEVSQLTKPFFIWLNRRKLFYSVFGLDAFKLFLVLC